MYNYNITVLDKFIQIIIQIKIISYYKIICNRKLHTHTSKIVFSHRLKNYILDVNHR